MGHNDSESATRHDVAVVGGGPAGSSAAVFTARYGLDTVVLDRGRSSMQRCAYLENYLGFPAGIDIETMYGLMHEHATEAGCEVVADLVESITRIDSGDGFVVETQEGRRLTARRVIAATRYGGEYLRPLDDDGEMFETDEYDGDSHERFDRSYPDADGTTPVEGLYVASPSYGADRQAIVAAGRGARVGLTAVGDVRREAGFPDTVADHYDWMRKRSTLDDEWADRDQWREWYDEKRPPETPMDDDRWSTMRERDIDRRVATYLTEEERDDRAERGQRRLLDQLDDELVVERAREIEAEALEASD